MSTNWEIFKEDTVYYFNIGMYGSYKVAHDDGYNILEYADFSWAFTKKDLKNGDVVLRRDGKVAIAIPDVSSLIFQDGHEDFDLIKDDLTSVSLRDCDIMAVRRPMQPADCTFRLHHSKQGVLLFKRQDPEEMTLEEICRELGREIKIVKNKS